jgi:sugar/nucleoside kinase (ribokinase family)
LKQPEIWKLVEGAKFFYVGGYHLTVCVPAILALAEEAASNDKVGTLLRGELGWKEALTQTDIHSQSLGAVHPAILQGPS